MIVNFSPGPAALPRGVRERIAEELDDWAGTGTSVMEVSHRGPEFAALAERSEGRLRSLLGLSGQHRILFMQGGASTQFALLPLNLAAGGPPPIYQVDGHWGSKAFREASKVTPCRARRRAELRGEAADYLHLTSNETVDGLQWRGLPDSEAPMVVDMSSDVLSAPFPVASCALAYAGAQKNLGIAGITVVVIREDLLERSPHHLPSMLSYRSLCEARSMANTPTTFAWYVLDLVLEWIESEGGPKSMARRNEAKARSLYAAIDGSDLFRNRVEPALRSRMNVVFDTGDAALDARFLGMAEAAGFRGLKGHRAVGGLRASLYNAIEPADVEALVACMREFERRA